MNKIQLLEFLTKNAKEYRKDAAASIVKNKHMNEATGEEVKQQDIDALLVDFINFIGVQQGADYALYTKDLES